VVKFSKRKSPNLGGALATEAAAAHLLADHQAMAAVAAVPVGMVKAVVPPVREARVGLDPAVARAARTAVHAARPHLEQPLFAKSLKPAWKYSVSKAEPPSRGKYR
jgi:hypothetical protein